MSYSSFRRAMVEVEAEIDTLAAELVRQGVPAWEAMEHAAAIVRRRRATQEPNPRK